MDERERLILLHGCSGVTWSLLHKFLLFDPSLEKIFTMEKHELLQNFSMKYAQAKNFLENLSKMNNMLQTYEKNDIQVLTVFDKKYPSLLKQIYDPPWVLYCKGDLSLFLEEKKISVVGTRDPSKNGLLSLEKIIIPLVQANWIVVSGLAVGIDGRAHMLAMENRGKTIAVLGSGFNYIYPHCHQKLASAISKNHLLISEFPPDRQPQKWNFPMRNRIISGLSKGTLIIEAKSRSGSLITADLALQQGREVFAVPGSILDDRTDGTHWLIQQGAKLTKCSNDVLNEM